ncbi:choice-of-anchor L domain-containing protein [Propionicicella superfundia]|uniref:choice-of-anchor L domain-containing protein n=1 Tax=Propionicicella superfundia TaxID=348582 RepID=UPI0012EB77CC|nr:choice-of-anchor L domain-containing protein [Propionicicella superfundia]
MKRILATVVVIGVGTSPIAVADETGQESVSPSSGPTTSSTPSVTSAPDPTAGRTVTEPAAPVRRAARAAAAATATDISDRSAAALVDALAGTGITVSNVSYTGSPYAAGTFSGIDVGIDSGVVLTTGSVETEGGRYSSVLGPNARSNTSSQWGTGGDTALDEIVAPSSTHDAAVLEFDFVPTGDQVTFSYVFGSEEYPEYVGGFNDVFAFWVNGVNHATFTDQAGQTQPVSVSTINAGRNADLYIDNDVTHATRDTELDGFTTVMTFVAPVRKGQTNHVRLAIADAGDTLYDSAVLLGAGTFAANTIPVAQDVSGVGVRAGGRADIPLRGSDADGDAITYRLAQAPDPSTGTVTVDPDSGAAVFTAAPGFAGTATFTYIVSDGLADSAPATVTVEVARTPSPRAATASPSTASPTTVSPTTDSLAATGTGSAALGAIGAGLALAGAVLVAASRRSGRRG